MWVSELVLLCFGFLNADDICIDFFEPVKKTFFRGGANTVGVGGNNTPEFYSYYVSAYDTLNSRILRMKKTGEICRKIKNVLSSWL